MKQTPIELADIYVKKIRKVCAECSESEKQAYKNNLDMNEAYKRSDLRIARILRNYERKLLNNKEATQVEHQI